MADLEGAAQWFDGDPEPQQVTSLGNVLVVDVGGARVDDGVVREQLDVALAEAHLEVERPIARQRIEALENGLLPWKKRGYVSMTAGRAEVTRIEEGAQASAPVPRRADGHRIQRPIAPGVHVERLEQLRRQLGILLEEGVEDGHRAGDPRNAALLGRLHTEQADDIGAITVEGEGLRRTVLTRHHPVGQSFVPHVPEQIAGIVLRSQPAEQTPERPKEPLDVGTRPAVDGHATNPDEPSTVAQLGSPTSRGRAQRRQGHQPR
ncbi:MAG: hypothetical protein AAF602_19110 [Myxococcota bacterium]